MFCCKGPIYHQFVFFFFFSMTSCYLVVWHSTPTISRGSLHWLLTWTISVDHILTPLYMILNLQHHSVPSSSSVPCYTTYEGLETKVFLCFFKIKRHKALKKTFVSNLLCFDLILERQQSLLFVSFCFLFFFLFHSAIYSLSWLNVACCCFLVFLFCFILSCSCLWLAVPVRIALSDWLSRHRADCDWLSALREPSTIASLARPQNSLCPRMLHKRVALFTGGKHRLPAWM